MVSLVTREAAAWRSSSPSKQPVEGCIDHEELTLTEWRSGSSPSMSALPQPTPQRRQASDSAIPGRYSQVKEREAEDGVVVGRIARRLAAAQLLAEERVLFKRQQGEVGRAVSNSQTTAATAIASALSGP